MGRVKSSPLASWVLKVTMFTSLGLAPTPRQACTDTAHFIRPYTHSSASLHTKTHVLMHVLLSVGSYWYWFITVHSCVRSLETVWPLADQGLGLLKSQTLPLHKSTSLWINTSPSVCTSPLQKVQTFSSLLASLHITTYTVTVHYKQCLCSTVGVPIYTHVSIFMSTSAIDLQYDWKCWQMQYIVGTYIQANTWHICMLAVTQPSNVFLTIWIVITIILCIMLFTVKHSR